jgi:hypothetical protein
MAALCLAAYGMQVRLLPEAGLATRQPPSLFSLESSMETSADIEPVSLTRIGFGRDPYTRKLVHETFKRSDDSSEILLWYKNGSPYAWCRVATAEDAS